MKTNFQFISLSTVDFDPIKKGSRAIMRNHVSKITLGIVACLLMMCCQSFAQQIVVHGKVVNSETLLGLQGASVTIEGKQGGTTAGPGGVFSIQAAVGDQLKVDFVGYSESMVTVEGTADITIPLDVSVKSLDEVVVSVGYGTQKKKDLTGAISSITLENSPLENLPNVNLLDALKGSMPGFDIGAVTAAGSNPSFNIRGQNSVRASNQPLVILDGVIFLGSFNELNPMDIATVDVLKDASSTAIYGSLAANGVVLITTKRGRTEKPTVQFNVTGGLQTYTNRPDMLSPEGYLQMKKDRFFADNPNAEYDINSNFAPYELEAYNDNHTIDWFKEVTRVGVLQNYGASVSGKSNRSNYYVSANYLNQEGIVFGDQFHKFSALAKI